MGEKAQNSLAEGIESLKESSKRGRQTALDSIDLLKNAVQTASGELKQNITKVKDSDYFDSELYGADD